MIKKPLPTVDDAWIQMLTERAILEFKHLIPENGTLQFSVARSKGIPVSLLPSIRYPDDKYQKAEVKLHRVGFCTNNHWDLWLNKVKAGIENALLQKKIKQKLSNPRRPYNRKK